MLIEEIKNIQSDKKELKKFGWTFAILFLILGGLFWWRGKNHYFYCFIFSILFLICSFVPLILKPFHKIWMTLALVIGYIVTRVILYVLFYFILTPVSVINKLLGNQFLDIKMDKTKESYWNYRKVKAFNKSDYEKQF